MSLASKAAEQAAALQKAAVRDAEDRRLSAIEKREQKATATFGYPVAYVRDEALADQGWSKATGWPRHSERVVTHETYQVYRMDDMEMALIPSPTSDEGSWHLVLNDPVHGRFIDHDSLWGISLLREDASTEERQDYVVQEIAKHLQRAPKHPVIALQQTHCPTCGRANS